MRREQHGAPNLALSAQVGSVPYTQLLLSWERSLKAANLSDETIDHYLTAAWALGAYLAQVGMPLDVEHIAREHIESFLAYLRDLGRKPATLHGRYASLKQLFKWLIEEGEIRVNPMEHIRAPTLDDTPPQLMTLEMVQKLLKVCSGTDFDARRDSAMVRLLIDTGMRAGSLAGIFVSDVVLDEHIVTIHAKGRKTRVVPFGVKTTAALDRYIRVRARHPKADEAKLWLAMRGGLHYSGIHGILNRRAEAAGLGHIHQHMFRHGFADAWLEAGGTEGDLMSIGGWEDSDVMRRYGRLTKERRARAAHQRLSPGDRL